MFKKKKPAEDTLVPPLRGTRGEIFFRFSRIVFSRCCTCTRRNLRFHVENCQHADQIQLTRREAFDLDIESTHDQPASCRTRPVNSECRRRPRRYQVDPRSREREVARGVLRSFPNLKKKTIFCHRRGIEIFCRQFSTQQRPNVCVSEAWPAPATYHGPFCEHL